VGGWVGGGQRLATRQAARSYQSYPIFCWTVACNDNTLRACVLSLILPQLLTVRLCLCKSSLPARKQHCLPQDLQALLQAAVQVTGDALPDPVKLQCTAVMASGATCNCSAHRLPLLEEE